MTNTKKCRLLQQYVDDGLGGKVVLMVYDKYSHDEHGKPVVREVVTVGDVLRELQENGRANAEKCMKFKEIIKAVEKDDPIKVLMVYEDTLKEWQDNVRLSKTSNKKSLRGMMR